MRVHGPKQERVKDESGEAADVSPQYSIDEKTKHKLFRHWRNRHGQDDNQDSLLDRVRAIEKFDNVLLARIAAQKTPGNSIGCQNQWISRAEQERARSNGTADTELGKSGRNIDIESAEL